MDPIYPSAAREIARLLRAAREPLADANARLARVLGTLRDRCDELVRGRSSTYGAVRRAGMRLARSSSLASWRRVGGNVPRA